MLFKVREFKQNGTTYDFSHYHLHRSLRQKAAKTRRSGPVVYKLISIRNVLKAVIELVANVAPISATT